MQQKFYCIPSPPLLFSLKALLGSLSSYIVVGLIGLLVVFIVHNYSKKTKLFDGKFWKLTIFIFAFTAFLTYFPASMDMEPSFNYSPDYLFAYVLFFGILLLGYLLGKTLKQFSISRVGLAILVALFLLSVALTIYALLQPQDVAKTNEKLKQSSCGSFSLW